MSGATSDFVQDGCARLICQTTGLVPFQTSLLMSLYTATAFGVGDSGEFVSPNRFAFRLGRLPFNDLSCADAMSPSTLFVPKPCRKVQSCIGPLFSPDFPRPAFLSDPSVLSLWVLLTFPFCSFAPRITYSVCCVLLPCSLAACFPLSRTFPGDPSHEPGTFAPIRVVLDYLLPGFNATPTLPVWIRFCTIDPLARSVCFVCRCDFSLASLRL